MNDVETDPSARHVLTKSCPKRTVVPSLLGLILTAVVLPVVVAASEDEAKDFPGLGEPRILFVADGAFRQGYWCSLAFTQDSKSLIGTLVRNPGSGLLFLLGDRVGEVRSFEVAAVDKASKIVTTGRNTQFKILRTPSGACGEPLLLARWAVGKFGKVTVFEITDKGAKESVVRQFAVPRPVPRAGKERDEYSRFPLAVAFAPSADTLFVGRGCRERKEERSPTVIGRHWRDDLIWRGDMKAWDVQTGEPCLEETWEADSVLAVAYSADGTLAAAGGGRRVPTPRAISPFHGHDGRVVCWDENFGKKRFDLPLPNHRVQCLAFAPNAETLVTGGLDGSVKWIDVKQGKVVKSLRLVSMGLGSIACLSFSADGRFLAVGVGSPFNSFEWGETFLIDVPKAKIYKVPSSREEEVVKCVAFSPNGKYLATAGMAGILKLWQIDGEAGEQRKQR